MIHLVGLPSVILTFPRYTQLFVFFFFLQSTSQAVSLKVDQTVFILMLFDKTTRKTNIRHFFKCLK